MILRNVSSGAIVATNVERAGSFVARGIGLLRRAAVGPSEGLWIHPCSDIHTFGMRAIIDVFFLDRDDRVLRIVVAAKPNRIFFCRGAKSVVELGACDDATRSISIGDRLTLE